MAQAAAPGVPEQAAEVAAVEAEPAAPAEASLLYRISLVDGKEISLSLSADASTRDLYTAVSAAQGVPVYQLKLIVNGHATPLPSANANLAGFFPIGASRDMLLVVTKGNQLGAANCSCDSACVEDTSFQHHSVAAFGLCPGEAEEEECEGRKFIVSPGDCSSGIHGAIFDRCSFEATTEAEPLSGRVLIRVVVHQRSYALGIGVATRELPLDKDPEYQPQFFGLYHGGHSTNSCGGAKRRHRGGGSSGSWGSEAKLAILVDTDAHTMQCFEDTEPFGPPSTLPDEPLWPVVVLWNEGDSASLSVTSI